jgi:hypothetical protein
MWITLWRQKGLTVGPGFEKGIAYLPDAEKRKYHVSNNLDEIGAQNDDGIYIKPIENGWYIVCVKSI